MQITSGQEPILKIWIAGDNASWHTGTIRRNGVPDSDYVRWAKEVLGISRAWIHRHKNGIGTVGVIVVPVMT
ncbi:baseplate J/gp47 family protein [Serratia symbiotica]|nr:baseplate J/gp47 family protein [Serratia symbiotica]